MYSSTLTTYQAELDYRRDRIRAGISTRPSRRRLRHRGAAAAARTSGPGQD